MDSAEARVQEVHTSTVEETDDSIDHLGIPTRAICCLDLPLLCTRYDTGTIPGQWCHCSL